MPLPSAVEIESAALKAWPGLEVAHDGAWIMRAANGYTRRANSVQSHDPKDDGDAPARLARARDWFESRKLTPVFRVTPLAGPRITAALDAAGWVPEDRSLVLAMELGPTEADPRARLLPPDSAEFLAAQRSLQNYSDAQVAKLQAITSAMTVPARGVVVDGADGQPAASAWIAIGDGMAVVGNVVTASSVRRLGFGAALMRSALAWAYGEGARVATHNVAADNVAGVALYTSLGYTAQYDYHYRVPPK